MVAAGVVHSYRGPHIPLSWQSSLSRLGADAHLVGGGRERTNPYYVEAYYPERRWGKPHLQGTARRDPVRMLYGDGSLGGHSPGCRQRTSDGPQVRGQTAFKGAHSLSSPHAMGRQVTG
jgi:hypothetical protein